MLEPLTFNSQSGSSGSLDPLTVTVSTHSGGKCSSSELDFVASEFYCGGGLKEVDTDPNHQRWTQPEASLFSEKNWWSFMKLCFQRSENESKCELHVLVAVAFRQVQSVRTVSPSTFITTGYILKNFLRLKAELEETPKTKDVSPKHWRWAICLNYASKHDSSHSFVLMNILFFSWLNNHSQPVIVAIVSMLTLVITQGQKCLSGSFWFLVVREKTSNLPAKPQMRRQHDTHTH